MGEGMGWRGKAQFICKQKPTDLDIVKKKNRLNGVFRGYTLRSN